MLLFNFGKTAYADLKKKQHCSYELFQKYQRWF